jgi:membrane-bound lytic murein transglycosylase B
MTIETLLSNLTAAIEANTEALKSSLEFRKDFIGSVQAEAAKGKAVKAAVESMKKPPVDMAAIGAEIDAEAEAQEEVPAKPKKAEKPAKAAKPAEDEADAAELMVAVKAKAKQFRDDAPDSDEREARTKYVQNFMTANKLPIGKPMSAKNAQALIDHIDAYVSEAEEEEELI